MIASATRRHLNALGQLFGSAAERDFLADYWERRPLHIARQAADYFGDLFSLDAFDALMTRGDVWYPNVRVFLTGKQLPAEDFTTTWAYGRETYRRIVDVPKLLELLGRGATINVLGLERTSAEVMSLSKELEITAGFPVHTTAFLSPPSAVNVPPHFDMVDVIVAQVYGSKVWSVWQPTREQPLVTDTTGRLYEHGDDVVAKNMLIGTYTLRAGDTLYVPRGFLHEAITTDEPSLHLAFGINVHRWIDLLESAATEAISNLTEITEFRKALPVPGAPEEAGDAAAEASIRAMSEELSKDLASSLEHSLRAADARYLDSRAAARPGQLLHLDRLADLALDDVLVLRPELAFGIWSEDGRLRLSFHQKRISLNVRLEPALRYAASGSPFRVGDLPELTAPQQRAFVHRLVSEGFLTFDDVEGGASPDLSTN